jgi:hypothetical protein
VESGCQAKDYHDQTNNQEGIDKTQRHQAQPHRQGRYKQGSPVIDFKGYNPGTNGGNKETEGHHQKDRSRLAVTQPEFLFYGRHEWGENDPADKGQEKKPGQENSDPNTLLEGDRCWAPIIVQMVINGENSSGYHDFSSFCVSE